MKLACASSAFDRAIERGELTQLEFVEACARTLACDGIVLDLRHFPRRDDDYLAQLRKMATDLGLDVAAVRDDGFFTANDEAMLATVERARALAAPLIAAPLGAETARPWSEQRERLNAAASLAKRFNVTLAVRNAAGTFGATAYDLRRAAKETDSAWLRFGLEPATLDAAESSALIANTVLLWADAAIRTVPAEFAAFRGYLALDDSSGKASLEELTARVAQWRAAPQTK